MPVRNAMPYLTACLESIINQSYTNWELIAVNDHSTDLSYNELMSFSIKDNRIKLYNNSGKGIIEALRMGLNYSTGNYITRMDADDLMPLNKLKLMSEALDKNPNSLITGKVKYISTTGRGYINYQNWLNDLVDNNSYFSEIYKECAVSSPCWMIKKDTLKHCGGFDSNTYPEDYDLCFRFYKNKVNIIGIKDVLHLWRDHGSRASRNDSNYYDNRFLELKTNYFFELDYNKDKTLFLWGAGGKAKNVANLIIEIDTSFLWGCNNAKKIGHVVYNNTLIDVENVLNDTKTNYQAIITVANPYEQREIKKILKSKKHIEPFWFC